ncbi:CAF17-like 4Fe-4S cluster assembly/insertion protein YgfZ [Hyphobacterium marinum]|uniref:CAF17 C-terminal domain-containing protein n=1 Tax=Hyphobacterium marinum TaxID=3116574 RepID=A0ABU7M1P7_9PROT|nr:hypothetical protein [Hyphobacterium sp. Y6023]MEE2567452.1 hypothetical protein [Hyphobacterium sp. Y6023]
MRRGIAYRGALGQTIQRVHMRGMSTGTLPPARLARRAVISVEGEESRDFLQRVLTLDFATLDTGAIRPAALLTPQGKILVDFLVHGIEGGVFLDVHGEAADALVKRLSMYRLRAKADIALREDLVVVAGKGAEDPRHAGLPTRAVVRSEDAPAGDGDADQDAAEIAQGVPAFGRDYAEADVFPTDVNLDLYGGVGWKKGCFVGQEVVSRMKRRGTIRKRSLGLTFEVEAPAAGTPVMAGDTPLGEITSSAGEAAIARLRLDRLEGHEDGIAADGMTARITVQP